MPKFIPDEIIDQIKARADIVDIIGSYLPLKRSGSSLKALCPFHTEKTPSFTVSPSKQMFYCFGCGKGGDVVKFVMEKENVDYPTALRILADRCGVIIPETSSTTPAYNKTHKDRLYKLHEELTKFYQTILQNAKNPAVNNYVKSRNISQEAIEKFKIGAAPNAWDDAFKMLSKLNYTNDEMLECGIIIRNPDTNSLYDRFRNRLIFPISDELGRIVGFSARTISNDGSEAKYINSPETIIFKKSRILYALDKAKEKIQEENFCILCEGQLDVIAMHSAGLSNAVAPQGTAFTTEQAHIIKRYTNKVVICFDGDQAGKKAALRAIEILLSLDMEPTVAILPPDEDPDSILKKHGKEALYKIILSPLAFYDFLIQEKIPSNSSLSPWEKNVIITELGQYLAKIASPIIRASIIKIISEKLSVPEKIIISETNKKKSQEFQSEQNFNQTNHGNQQIALSPEAKLRKAEETLLELCLSNGTFCKKLAEDIEQELISNTPVGRAIETAVSMSLNGEWENVLPTLRDNLDFQNDSTICRILAFGNQYEPDLAQKAYSDCVKTIKIFHLEKKIKQKQDALKQENDPLKKSKLINEISNLRKEILSINKLKF